MNTEVAAELGIFASVIGAEAVAAWARRTGRYRAEADTPRRNLTLWWWLAPTLAIAWIALGATAR